MAPNAHEPARPSEGSVTCSDLICELEAELKSTIADEHRFRKGSPSMMWMEGYKDGLKFAISKERRRSQIQ
jgi:hypothetical protein